MDLPRKARAGLAGLPQRVFRVGMRDEERAKFRQCLCGQRYTAFNLDPAQFNASARLSGPKRMRFALVPNRYIGARTARYLAWN
jgi:hypothetical protein